MPVARLYKLQALAVTLQIMAGVSTGPYPVVRSMFKDTTQSMLPGRRLNCALVVMAKKAPGQDDKLRSGHGG
eukprot:IDg8822t1